jgi:hypothetical protein
MGISISSSGDRQTYPSRRYGSAPVAAVSMTSIVERGAFVWFGLGGYICCL